MYDVSNGGLKRIAQNFHAPNAHVVAVDPAKHRVYFPLQHVGGKPMIRVLDPARSQQALSAV